MSGKTEELKLDDLDKVTGGGLGDMSESEYMKLQMAMDRRSKFLEILSNIMKHISGTDDQITKNLK